MHILCMPPTRRKRRSPRQQPGVLASPQGTIVRYNYTHPRRGIACIPLPDTPRCKLVTTFSRIAQPPVPRNRDLQSENPLWERRRVCQGFSV